MNIIQINLQPNEKIAFCGDIHIDSITPHSRVDNLTSTALGKLEDMFKKCLERNVKHLFFEGDIFNRIAVPHVVINLFGELLIKYKQKGLSFYTICGNHDIIRASMEAFEKSPLQTLFTFKVIEHINLDSRVIINKSVLITPCDYTEYPPLAEPKAKVNILLAHMFFNQSDMIADARHNLSKDDTTKLGYDFMFLGHDHEYYNPTKCGKTLVYRHGSLLRGTAHNYNFTRKPLFIVLNDINNICEDTIEEVVISHREYKEIASSYVINKKTMGSITGLADVLSNLAEKLAESTENDGDRIMEILKTDENLPVECRMLIMKYIQENS